MPLMLYLKLTAIFKGIEVFSYVILELYGFVFYI